MTKIRPGVVFIDRDGTLIDEPKDTYVVHGLDQLEFIKDVIVCLRELVDNGFRLVVVTNQDGLGEEYNPVDNYEYVNKKMISIFKSQGITFYDFLMCPHWQKDGCNCRKPLTGMIDEWAAYNEFDPSQSYMIGDRETDVILGERIGGIGLLLTEEFGWRKITDKILLDAGIKISNNSNIELPMTQTQINEKLTRDRIANISRYTKETKIDLFVNLDKTGNNLINTGINFFDHMLDQIAVHSQIRLQLCCKGDLHIDDHHTIEDVAIALGTAIREALGDKFGINRFASADISTDHEQIDITDKQSNPIYFALPMDEASARVLLDLSGRFYLSYKEPDNLRDTIGDYSTEMTEHFFQSLANAMSATLHIESHGKNTHHVVEATYKAFAKALGVAIKRTNSTLPSSKGVF